MASVPFGNEQRALALAVLVLGLGAAARPGTAAVEFGSIVFDVRVDRDHHDVVERLVVLPVRRERALDGQEAGALELRA